MGAAAESRATNALKQHHIGLEEIDSGIWSIYLGSVLRARLDERDYIIRG